MPLPFDPAAPSVLSAPAPLMPVAASDSMGDPPAMSALQWPVRRFAVGDGVLCRIGPEEWSAGRVVAVNHREECWATGCVEPYMVELEDKSDVVLVHVDTDEACRRLTAACSSAPWWAPMFADKSGSHFAKGAQTEVDALKRIVDGRDVNEQDDRGENALLIAVRYSWVGGIRELLALRADPNCKNDSQQSPLHLAVFGIGRELTVIGMLLQARADPSLQGSSPERRVESDGLPPPACQTPLHCSAGAGLLGISAALIEGRADIDVRDAQSHTPLRLCIREGHEELVELLLRAGADVNVGSEPGSGTTPLMDAVYRDELGLARRLIEARADVNRAGRQGLAALHLAARSGRIEMAQLLLESGADRDLPSQLGTAVDIAARRAVPALVELLGATPRAVAPKLTVDSAAREALFT
eukprot:CAMPEP_0179055202 /NCGR_PEP_ID=MMETSP0796-20121207/23179_1 /TAXON_ID=73915 /ORGANISM="Pyrodinium bahamense, Strain pbaha01" /LENGTH=412 /DNA_ID=CAMNT_0020751847 /DNA_START=1 /DNA_END=1237 /DNA_ORIENTATION=-